LAAFWLGSVFNILEIQDDFYIQFQRSGGFTGIANNVDIDSKKLDAGEVEKIRQMIDQCNFFEFQHDDSLSKNIPDQFQYIITIEQRDQKKTVELTDSTVPEHFIPLVNYLNQKARAAR
jgi:hypothetical protein